MSNNLMENLNKEQLKAVTHKDGPVLIVAGAGTGKTTVITQRIAYLIEQGKASSEEVLALTFTEKAAGEMEERVDRLLPFGYLDLWISTFHSFGERILRAHGLEIGLPADFKLLNEFQQWSLIKKNLEKFNLNYYQPLGNPTKFIHALVRHFSRAKDEDISCQEYLDFADDLRQNSDQMLGGSKKKSSKLQFLISNYSDENGKINKEILTQEVDRINEVANAYHVYQQLLLDEGAMDFGDLINYTLRLFRERPKILQKYRQQFKYILLDEFQDTNLAQYELVKILVEPKNNLMVVGDDDQSVYKFRGASISNILQFKKDYKKSQEIILTNNYRNSQNILDLSYDFIQLNNPNRLEHQLEGGLSKKLKSQTKVKGTIGVIEGKDLQDEVKKIAEKIADLKIKDKQSTWNDFAILVRANDSAKDFCNILEIAGLPYQFMASRGLYAKPVIMDVTAYLRLLDNYHESISLYRVLDLSIFNFTYSELVNLNFQANKKAWSLFEVLKNASALKLEAVTIKKINQVLSLIEKHTSLVRERSASEIILAFLNDSGYLKNIIQLEEAESREQIAYLNQFLKRIKSFEASQDDKSVKAFLSELALEIDAGEEGSITPDMESGPESIKIMTAHAAKGLEFKYVFIPNMVDKRFPTIERRDQIEIPDALIKEEIPEGNIHLEEERRLFYVAITRAKEQIFFSWSQDYGGARSKKPSRFLIEAGLIESDKPAVSIKTGTKDRALDLKLQPKAETTDESKYEPPKHFSYSQLAAFSNCPYQYRFAHILRIPRTGKAQFSFGKTMHSVLQRLFELINERKGLGQGDLFTASKTKDKVKISFEEILKLYEECWIDNWYQSAKQKTEYRARGKEILKEFYETYKDNWPNVVYLEKGFSLKIVDDKELFTIRGVIDRLDEVKGKLRIVDYKTGKPKEKLSFDDKEQLLIYHLAVEDLFKQEVDSLAFYFLENNSEQEFKASPEDIDKVKGKIVNTIRDINKGEFLPKPSLLCKFCDFKDICEFRK